MKLLLTFLLFFTFNLAHSKRYIIPADADVMSQIGNIPTREGLSPESIKVLVWNMYKGSNQSWGQDFQTLSEDADVLVLQEGFLTKKMNDQFLDLNWFEFHFATSFIDNKLGATATGVVTSSVVKSEETVWQRSYYREPAIKTPKMTLFTKYSIKGLKQKLLVGNIHGVNFVRAYKLRHMLDKAAEQISKHAGPVLFGGDFNTWTQTKINNMNAVFRKLGMKSVKFAKDNRKKFAGKILDHIWVKGLKVLKANAPTSKGSDHNPMVLEVQVLL